MSKNNQKKLSNINRHGFKRENSKQKSINIDSITSGTVKHVDQRIFHINRPSLKIEISEKQNNNRNKQ